MEILLTMSIRCWHFTYLSLNTANLRQMNPILFTLKYSLYPLPRTSSEKCQICFSTRLFFNNGRFVLFLNKTLLKTTHIALIWEKMWGRKNMKKLWDSFQLWRSSGKAIKVTSFFILGMFKRKWEKINCWPWIVILNDHKKWKKSWKMKSFSNPYWCYFHVTWLLIWRQLRFSEIKKYYRF